jgi:SAM-dependent methyltransferase
VESAPIISGNTDWRDWLASPPGRYILDWEQGQFDAAVADVFGFYALQCGLPQLDCLRANRMPSRVHARFLDDVADQLDAPDASVTTVRLAHFEELPFDSQSLDLVVLPHVLEFAQDPHQVLREVERVLRPEGRLIVSGMNPVSLWGARQVALRRLSQPFLPRRSGFIGPPRLRDWLKLLGFELDRGRYGCYRPPCRTQQWLDRTAFMERMGDRWWPICGAIYLVSAIKRVRGMRLIGPAWRSKVPARARVSAATPQRVSIVPNARKEPAGAVALSDTCSDASAAEE